AVYSTMIMGLPVVPGFWRRIRSVSGDTPGRDVDRMAGWLVVAFVAATLANIADVTQVAQLGRYYLPVFILALPTAAAGLQGRLAGRAVSPEGVALVGGGLGRAALGGPDVGL